MRRSTIEQLPIQVRKEIDTRLIESGFTGYVALEAELRARGYYRVSKSGLHRYGQQVMRRLQLANAQAQLIEAGIDRNLAAEMTGEATLVVVIDRRNGIARMKTVSAPVAAVLSHLKTLVPPSPAPSAAGVLPAIERPERPAGLFIPECR
jgi:hypothetical protein